ncbi:MAG: ArnT family glycosyltransferase [Saprospiraceae bacterium]
MRLDHLRIAGLALLFFVPFLGGVHLFDQGEVNSAESAREMLITGDYLRPQMDYALVGEQPPFFIWLQTLSMTIFGVNEFAVRFPNVIAGLLTMLLAYHLGRRLHDRAFGWLWALAWLGSLLPHLYFRSGFVDPWFNLLFFTGLFGFVEFRWLFFTRFEGRSFWRRYRYLIIGGGLLGLAMLTQGPVAFLIALLVLLVYWARYKFRNRVFLYHLLLYSLAAFSVPALWLLAKLLVHGSGFIDTFFASQFWLIGSPDSSAGGFLGYQALVLLLGCFPVSVFAMPNLWGDRQPEEEVMESDTLASCQRSDLTTWMQILFWTVFVLCTLAPTKFAHVSSLAFFPLTYLGTLSIWRALRWNVWPKIVAPALLLLGVLIGLIQMLMPIVGKNTHWLQGFFENDPYVQARLQVAVNWHWWQGLPGLLLAAASLAAWRLWLKKRPWLAAQTAFAGGAIFVAATLVLCINNFERYTQLSTIEFYESKAGQNCIIIPVGFKTNAHLYYSQKSPHLSTSTTTSNAVTTGEKKVYVVARQNNLKEIPVQLHCRELFRMDGMVYFECSK